MGYCNYWSQICHIIPTRPLAIRELALLIAIYTHGRAALGSGLHNQALLLGGGFAPGDNLRAATAAAAADGQLIQAAEIHARRSYIVFHTDIVFQAGISHRDNLNTRTQ